MGILSALEVATRRSVTMQRLALALVAFVCGCDDAPKAASRVDETTDNCAGRSCGDAGHGEYACENRKCELHCEQGYAECAAGSGCRTQLSTSRAHCGRCDNPCNTGYCQSAACVEPKALATDLADMKFVSQIGTELLLVQGSWRQPDTYWTALPGDGGRKPFEISGLLPWVMAGGYYYGCIPPVEDRRGTCRVARKPTQGGKVQQIGVVKLPRLGAMAVDGAKLYVGITSDKEGMPVFERPAAILTLPVDGGEPEQLIEAGSQLDELAAADGDVFWCENDRALMALRKGTDESSKLAEDCESSLQVVGEYLYFSGRGVVRRVPRAGGSTEWISVALRANGSPSSIKGFRILSDTLYYGVRGKDLDLYSLPLPTAKLTM
jgi:hypothetical protein